MQLTDGVATGVLLGTEVLALRLDELQMSFQFVTSHNM